MKVRVTLGDIDETFEGQNADDILRKAKNEAAQRAPFLMRAIINNMSDLGFAGEVVKRSNQEEKRGDALPQSAQEFLDWAVQRGFVTIES